MLEKEVRDCYMVSGSKIKKLDLYLKYWLHIELILFYTM